ncbi:MAG: DUF11 domain-containing protein [Chloroflexi bacterium]|nr:DUF11 domain-containing protein [Chloroflexota bacterium]
MNRTVAAPGDILTYTIMIHNDSAGVDVWMTDTLPTGLTYKLGSLDWHGPGNAVATDNTIAWSATNFGWQTVLITFSAEISSGISYAEIVNTAQFTGTGGLIEFSSEETIVVAAIGNLDNENTYKTVTPQGQVEPGDVLTYTIRLTNDSSDPVPGVQVVDELPLGLSLVDGSIITDAGSYVAQNDIITWTLDVDGNWGNIDLVFQAEVLSYEGLVTNTAQLTAPSHQSLTLTSPAVDVYQRHPNLEVSKSVSPDQARPGELLTYTVHIVNTGEGTAETVWMTDVLPSEVIYQSGDVSRGSFDETDGVITWNVSSGGTLVLPPLDEAFITFTVQISPNIDRNIEFINTAEVTGAGTLVEDSISARAMVTAYIYLPLIVRRWPPVPYEPTMQDINNPNQDPDYTVSWSYDHEISVTSYTLQEATNASFTADLKEYNLGSDTSYVIGSKDNGTYYYRVKGYNSYGYGSWSNVESTTVFIFAYFEDFSDYDHPDAWPKMWEKTRGALYAIHPYEHPKCPGSECDYNGDGYIIARRRGNTQPYARFGPDVTIPSENYEIEFDARWWDAQYHATYKIFFGSDSSFLNYYSLDVLIDDPSVLPSHCWYRVTRRLDSSGTKELQDWERVAKEVIDCRVREQDSETPWNHFKIRREDNWITIHANGEELGSWYDETFGADLYFGVGATCYEGLTPSKPEFDNWSVIILP